MRRLPARAQLQDPLEMAHRCPDPRFQHTNCITKTLKSYVESVLLWDRLNFGTQLITEKKIYCTWSEYLFISLNHQFVFQLTYFALLLMKWLKFIFFQAAHSYLIEMAYRKQQFKVHSWTIIQLLTYIWGHAECNSHVSSIHTFQLCLLIYLRSGF